jgi:hypothetical protein
VPLDPDGGEGGGAQPSELWWVPITDRRSPLSACAVGDAVSAVWAGNRQRQRARVTTIIPASRRRSAQKSGAGDDGPMIEVEWEDLDPSFRRVPAEQVFKVSAASAARVRVRGEITGPGKYENVDQSQSVLIMINPMIFPRTHRRTSRCPASWESGEEWAP